MISIHPQLQAILENHTDPLLILGGPGSGKTTAALLKAKNELPNLQEFQRILFLSFSHSAILQIKKASGIHLAAEDFRLIQIQTFHSFCFHILRSFAGLLGIKQPVKILSPEEVKVLQSKLNISTQNLKNFLTKKGLNEGVLSFDIFSEFVNKILRNNQVLKLINSCYPLIIIDEFQDTDKQEWELIKAIGAGSRLVCLADPLQKIYSFREGVSNTRIDEYKTAFNPAVIDLSDNNFRSGGNEILDFADYVMSRQNPPQLTNVRYKTYNFPNAIPLTLKSAVLDMRQQLITEKNVSSPRIVIMARENKTVSFLSEKLSSTSGTIKTPIRHDALHDDNQTIFAQRILCELMEAKGKPVRDLVNAVIEELINFNYAWDTSGARALTLKLSSWRDAYNREATLKKFKEFDYILEIAPEISSETTGDLLEDAWRLITKLIDSGVPYFVKVATLLKHKFPFHRYDPIIGQVGRLYTDSSNYIGLKNLFARHHSQKRMMDAYREFSDVTIMTMHKSKGKEYDGAILFHDPNHPLVSNRDLNDIPQISMVLRVAVTRARHYVTILHQKDSLPNLLAITTTSLQPVPL